MNRFRVLVDQHRGAATAAMLTVVVILLLTAGFLALKLLQGGPTAAGSPTQAPSTTEVTPPSAAESSARPSPAPPDELVFGRIFAGVVLVDNLRVREEPVSGVVRTTLQAGDIVHVQGDPQAFDGSDWYQIQSGTDTYGWISAGPEGQYLELHRYVAQQAPATVEGVAGGPTGYLAWGVSAGLDAEHRDRFVAVSTDGSAWQLGPVPDAASTAASVAADYGPAGWLLAASNADNTATAGFWRSVDGLNWEAIDANLGPSLGIQSIVGSTSGYLVDVYDYHSFPDSRFAVFASRDGGNWREVDIGPEVHAGRIAQAGDGFVIWAEQPEPPGSPDLIRYSPDGGATWVDPSMDGRYPAPTDIAAIAVTDRQFVALTIDSNTEDGAVGVWTATLPLRSDAKWPALAWKRQLSADALLAATAIGRLVALEGRVLAFGNTYETGEPVVWSTTDGTSWEQVSGGGRGLAAALGPSAVGASGLVGVAPDVTTAGENPRFWRSRDGAAWQGEASPVVAPVDHAVFGACPGRPSTMLDFMAVPGAVGADCFRDAPITFRGWLTVGGGCGGYMPGIFEPGWLASPFVSLALNVTPDEEEYNAWGCGWGAVHPLELTALPPQQWVQVTGHWADPASATCRVRPDPAYPGAYAAGSLAFRCRTTFVATALAPSP